MKKHNPVQDRFRDKRAQRVIGFLAAKKLLIANQFKLWPTIKINVEDAVWVGKNVEPRVLEVLPAALIRFPKTFMGQEKIPTALRGVIDAIRRNEADYPDYEGFKYQDMKRWANRVLPDKRTKPLKAQKRNKTFRLQPKVIENLKRLAEQNNVTETKMLEKLVLNQKQY